MAVKISELDTTTAVTGDETIAVVQNGRTKGVGIGDIVPIRRTAAEVAAGVTPTDFRYPPGDVRRYGAVGDGVTDDTAAIRAAVSVMEALGGGTIHFAPGATHLLSTVGTHSVVVPIQGANYTDDTEDYRYHVLLDEIDGITFDLHGSTLVSSITNGGAMFLLDGCRGIKFINGKKIQGQEAHDATGATTVAGIHAVAATSQGRDSFDLTIDIAEVEDAVSTFYCFGTDNPTFRVRGVKIKTGLHNKGRYPIALHMNGDNVTVEGLHTVDVLRACFIYGVDGFDLKISNEDGVAGFTPVIKAYTRDTTNGKLRYRTTANVTGGAHLFLQSDYDTDTQATPKKLLNIELDLDNSQGQILPAVQFDVYEDGVLVDATTQVFHGIVLKGIHQNAPTIASTQDDGSLDTDGVILLAGGMTSVYDETGFYDPKQRWSTFNPTLRVNNLTTGITYSVRKGEYWRDGRFIEAIYDFTLSSKGAQSGGLSLDLPVTSSSANLNNAIIVSVLGFSNMAGLVGPIIGYVQTSGDGIILEQQDATAVSQLQDENITDTSRLQVHVRYPIW